MREDYLISTSSFRLKKKIFLSTFDHHILYREAHISLLYLFCHWRESFKREKYDGVNNETMIENLLVLFGSVSSTDTFRFSDSRDYHDGFRKRIRAERSTPNVWQWLRISSSFHYLFIFPRIWWCIDFKKKIRSCNFTKWNNKTFHTIYWFKLFHYQFGILSTLYNNISGRYTNYCRQWFMRVRNFMVL